MNTFKGTPGPWYHTEFSGYWNIMDGERYESNNILDSDNVGESIAEANAQLIACAPEMLDALISIRTKMLKSGITYDNADQYNLVNNAIQKATTI